MNKNDIQTLVTAAADFLAGLVPGAIGATLNIAFQTGLTWTQRFIQLATGIIVSYYAGEAAREVFHLTQFATDSVSFTAGLVAYNTAKRLNDAIPEVVARIPGELWDSVKARLGGTPREPRE